ncbi:MULTISPECIES: DMT family transporter [unclassified Shinella]|uniref:DMT family transporter n=1 Tax=unclassified Shinella TaxID=2643062 RepID=UPI00225C6AC5|nr:EamA family transporter [Shinella sp. YE25]MDC7259451.1 EamA family transporter [Shinella sp. YE25]CAI0341205.1 Permease of the drug/metabolite transporter (DMT) superfamily [Rhizobiaceae bacterium]CAK7260846.1 Multidrug transporter [Shinella sp. WSC3-e]
MNRNAVKFLVLCLIWGKTWIGIKAGVAAVPPLMFAGTRFSVAGALILAGLRLQTSLPRVSRDDWPRLCFVTLLMIPLCYGPLFWGMLYVDSGMAAVLELSLTPIALLCFALLLRDERFNGRRLFAIALGVAGLCILFGPEAYAGWRLDGDDNATVRLVAAFAVASAAVIYAWGSVLARPLLATYSAGFLAGWTTLFGGLVLIVASLAIEPGAISALHGNWGWAAWAGWLFLVLFGSLIGYTLFMRLLRDVGASRAGSYAFVSPVIAVLLGIVTYGEQVTLVDVVAMVVMLVAAYLAMHEPGPEHTATEAKPI